MRRAERRKNIKRRDKMRRNRMRREWLMGDQRRPHEEVAFELRPEWQGEAPMESSRGSAPHAERTVTTTLSWR